MTEPPQDNFGMEVITGMLHRELESELFKRLSRIKQDDPLEPAIVLVGSRLLELYLTDMLVEKGRAQFNVRFITFADLIKDISLVGRMVDSRPKLPKIGKRAIISEVVGAVDAENYFVKVTDRSGFQRNLASTFNDIDHSGIDFVNENQTKQLTNRRKWASLRKMFKSYQQILCQFRTTQDEITKSGDLSQAFERVYQCRRIFIYGFYDFTPGQFKIIEELSEKIAILALIPYWSAGDDFGSALQYASPAYTELMKLTRQKEQKLLPESGCQHKGFGFRLFRYNPSETGSCFIPAGRQIRIIKGLDITDEIERISGKINELVLYKDIRLDRIGILLWHPEIYRNAVCSALNRAGLPYCDSIGTPLNETPEGRITEALLKLISHQLKRRDVVDLLSTYQVRLANQEGDVRPDEVIWEKLSNQFTIIAGRRDNWDRALADGESYIKDAGYRTQAGLFRDFINKLFECFEKIPANGSYLDYVSGIQNYLNEFIPEGENKDKILELVDSLAGLAKIGEKTNRSVFIDLFLESMRAVSCKKGQFGSGVTIFDKMTGRGVAFDVLFIPGLVQGAIPISTREDPILSDFDRRSIKKQAGNDSPFCLPLGHRRREEERLLYSLAVDSARKQLFLTFPGFDSEGGRQNLPSGFLLDLCRILYGRPISSDKLEDLPILEKPGDISPDKKETFHQSITLPSDFVTKWIEMNVLRNQRHFAVRQIYSGRIEAYERNRKAFLSRRNQTLYSAWDGVEMGMESSPTQGELSYPVTSLESYAECPFRYWLEKVLKLKLWEEPEMVVEIPANVTGTIIHHVLKSVYDEALNQKMKPGNADSRARILEVAAENLRSETERFKRECPAPPVIWALTVSKLESRLKNFLRSEFEKQDGFEYQEGESKIETSLSFMGGSAEFSMNIVGRIDRLDRSVDGKSIRIIDYKTGRTSSKPEEFRGGKKLQLPLYLKSLLDGNSGIDPNNSIAEYLHIKPDGGSSRSGINGAIVKEREEDLAKILGIITSGIAEQYFPPIPEDNNCQNCPVTPACNQLSRSKYYSVTDDPQIESLKLLRDIN